MMRIAIMQPYFLPYIGYFQLIGAVDAFVIYDNIKYTKKGWINRNRFLRNGEPATFTLPLANDSDHLDVRDRVIAPDFQRKKLLAQFEAAYRKAPNFARVFPLLQEIVEYPDTNLFGFVQHSLARVCEHIGIRTPLVVSSTVPADHTLKSQDRVLSICHALNASTYINPIGGTELYDARDFSANEITLKFLKPHLTAYAQFSHPFVPGLSIIDVLMFSTPDQVRDLILHDYVLLDNRSTPDTQDPQ